MEYLGCEKNKNFSIWSLFSRSGSLWVAWVHENWLKGGVFGRFSSLKMLFGAGDKSSKSGILLEDLLGIRWVMAERFFFGMTIGIRLGV